jgi:uncharacterized coiled-coil DUF342 family protein
MIDEKINQTLKELELGLKDLDSARKQVEKTVKSYDGLTEKTETYVNSLSAVKDKLEQLVELLGKDYKAKNLEFKSDCSKIISSCESAVEKYNNTVEDIRKTYITNIYKNFKILFIFNAVNTVILVVIAILYFLS